MDGDPTMEHYDWNDGWLFCPTFDPALVRPECTGLELESVRIPHTVKALPYNYCNENDHQRLCGYRREFFAPAEWAGRTVLLTFGAIAHDATVFCNGYLNRFPNPIRKKLLCAASLFSESKAVWRLALFPVALISLNIVFRPS